jgi:hypothetical protein
VPFSYAQYTGNGSAVNFSVPFPYLLKAHVKVYTGLVIETGAYTTLLALPVAWLLGRTFDQWGFPASRRRR